MTFEEVWNDDDNMDAVFVVRNGKPPPSANTEGLPYKAWSTNNFTGTLEEKITRSGWRYLKFEVLPSDTGEHVEYLAYEIADGGTHTFEAQ